MLPLSSCPPFHSLFFLGCTLHVHVTFSSNQCYHSLHVHLFALLISRIHSAYPCYILLISMLPLSSCTQYHYFHILAITLFMYTIQLSSYLCYDSLHVHNTTLFISMLHSLCNNVALSLYPCYTLFVSMLQLSIMYVYYICFCMLTLYMCSVYSNYSYIVYFHIICV